MGTPLIFACLFYYPWPFLVLLGKKWTRKLMEKSSVFKKRVKSILFKISYSCCRDDSWLSVHTALAEDPSYVPVRMWCGLKTLGNSIFMASFSLFCLPQALYSCAKKKNTLCTQFKVNKVKNSPSHKSGIFS